LNRRARLGIATISALVAGLIACEDNQTPPKPQPFEGILEFDIRCDVLGGDTTDFYPRPLADTTVAPPFEGPPVNYSLIGACPNPNRGMTWIEFQVPRPDSVWLLVYDRTNSPPIDTLWAARCPSAGVYSQIWSNPGRSGILRVEMHTESGFRSHGDVLFTP
jgi:hypothetical protein